MEIKTNSNPANFYVRAKNKRVQEGEKPDVSERLRKLDRLERLERAERGKKREGLIPEQEAPKNPIEKRTIKDHIKKGRLKRAGREEMTAEELRRMLDNTKMDASPAQIMMKCLRIAMRIIQGDNVPHKDDKFLMQNNPDLHLQAWSLRQYKADPEDHDSETEEEGGIESEMEVLAEAMDILI